MARQPKKKRPLQVKGNPSVPKPTPKASAPPIVYGPKTKPRGGSGMSGLSWDAAKGTWDLQTGKAHRWAYRKLKQGSNRAAEAFQNVASNPRGEGADFKKQTRELLKKKPITHMAKKVKRWWQGL